ncbi:hypothetical protein [Anaeromyxobacter sp. K]|uniref:hypothetical protein n=1 Tax=Anaeromyxobacter sp. (strain K) TaxID=447217 RepID=UPI001E59DB4C|nr:hypothetical protein [Anaeromyxobacter sp. K]
MDRAEVSMALSGVVGMAIAAALASGGERLLLCRPVVDGDPALARADAVGEAARARPGRWLDYGVACDGAPEGARAARRAGLAHAVVARAEGRSDGSRFVLVLTDATTEEARAQRRVDVPPGKDAVRPLRTALDGLLQSLPPEPGPGAGRIAAWSLAGAGAASLIAGVALAVSASSAADRADAAADPAAYTRARADWRSRRRWSAAALGAGGAALAAGLTWRFVF